MFAGYAAIGLLIAAIAVLGAFLFEIFSLVSSRKPVSTTRPATATTLKAPGVA
jgi:hypothetical protein